MMTEIRTATAFSGPFFERDPKETVRQNIRDMLVALAAEGQSQVQAVFPVKTGAGRAGVVGRVQSMTGKPWYLNAVVSEQHVYPWGTHRGATIRSGRRRVANHGAAEYRGGKLERKLGMFARVNRQLQQSRAVIAADLSKGLV